MYDVAVVKYKEDLQSLKKAVDFVRSSRVSQGQKWPGLVYAHFN